MIMIIIIDKLEKMCYTQSTKEFPTGTKGGCPVEKKLRYSHQRERIHQYLMESHTHPSAETIFKDLREEIPGLSLGTVYRNLKLLEELGKVRRVASFQVVERYDACCGDHAHFLCNVCGCVRDVAQANTEAVRAAVSLEEGFRLSNLNLTLMGLCPNCAEV